MNKKSCKAPPLEYVVVMVSPAMGIIVTPDTPATHEIVEGAYTLYGVAGVVNKLAALGFRLLEGTVLETDGGKISGTFFMWRERRDD
jgi:hypothetical protein